MFKFKVCSIFSLFIVVCLVVFYANTLSRVVNTYESVVMYLYLLGSSICINCVS